MKKHMGKKVKESDGSMPDIVSHQISEHSPEGWLLFYFNAKTGQPDQVMSFSAPSACLALQKYIEDWDAALQQVSHDNTVQNIQRNLERMNEENNGEEE